MTTNYHDQLYFGQPLIDAVELQNELRLFGVVLHHTVEKGLENFDINNESPIVKIRVPMKSAKITYYLVNWINNTDVTGEDSRKLVSRLYSEISGEPRIYVDNTIDFINDVLKRRQEKKS